MVGRSEMKASQYYDRYVEEEWNRINYKSTEYQMTYWWTFSLYWAKS